MRQTRFNTQAMVAAALLSAIGVAIPMFSPIKIIIGPASYTLASHVPIFIAMFLSPSIAASVSLITTIGFFLGGFPLVIVLRALTHLVFAIIGALILRRFKTILSNPTQCVLFSALISAIHAACEVAAVAPFYYGGTLGGASYSSGFFVTVVLLVGIGSFVHSMLDFTIAKWIWHIIFIPKQRKQ